MNIFQPTFFSPIIHYALFVTSNPTLFEVEDNYQKQTYRNRCYVFGPQGKQLLNVPVQQQKGIKQKTKDVLIDYKDNWQSLHLKSLKTAYNSSPFFEFYIDDLLPVYRKKTKFLLDLNFKTHEFVLDALQLEIPIKQTTEYKKNIEGFDTRLLANSKLNFSTNFKPYKQVFDDSFGFIENLSILDLIFNEGPNALNYLESQQIDF